MKVYSHTIHASILKGIYENLINRSAYFSIDPLPDDQYTITVKEENKLWLQNLITEFSTKH